MTLRLYDLAAADDAVRFSPYCWRAKMALKHKGLDFETVPWRFTEKDVLAPTGQGRVPVLVDGDRWISDSWAIALYLDEAHGDRPALFGSPGEVALARFVNQWCDNVLHLALRAPLLLDIFKVADARDRDYFRASREKMIGVALEEACLDREADLAALKRTLYPVEMSLKERKFLSGDAPAYADFCLFGSLMWAHVISPEPVLRADTAVAAWFEAMLDLHGGYARAAPRAGLPAAA